MHEKTGARAVLLKDEPRRIRPWWLVHAVLLVLVTIMWWPALFRGKSILHGDALIFSLPLLEFLKNYLHGGPSPLWVGQVLGGHPLFAEGQGAFLAPLNLLVAWLFPPVLGSNVFHYMCMLGAGIGVMQLCRQLGRSAWAAGAAGLTVVFSSCWIHQQHNMTIAGALLWVPWLLLAFERWLASPTLPRALCMSVLGCLLVFAGYPQVLQASGLFMLCSMPSMFFARTWTQHWQRHKRAFVLTALVAGVLCLGFSAVQLLPTLELATWSHRRGGVELFPFFHGFKTILRGLFFPLAETSGMPAAGSLLACMLACLGLLLRAPARAKGYLISTCVVLVLSFGPSSLLFRLIYSVGIVPGLHFFRVLFVYSAFVALGIAVLAAFAIDALRTWLRDHAELRAWRPARWLGLLVFLAVGVALAYGSHPLRGLWTTLLITLAACVLALLLTASRRVAWLPAAMFLLVMLQCMLLDLHTIRFYAAPALPTPSLLDRLDGPAPQDRKLWVSSVIDAYGMLDSRTHGLDHPAQRALATDAGLSNLLRGTWSLNGTLGLELRNRTLIDEPVRQELQMHTAAAPGARLIDLLAIRYIATDHLLHAPGLQLFGRDATDFWVMKNTFAHPFLQVYKDAAAVDSAEAALDRLHAAQVPQLVVQKDPRDAPLPPPDTTPGDVSQVHTVFEQRHSDYYAIDVQSPFACWLFLADANYPGWHAQVDGHPTTVWTAQLLGKAIHVPAGTHHVVVAFRSDSFRLGALISLLSLLTAAVLLMLHAARQRSPAVMQESA
ncbi:hypothetical protein [Dyella acidiphila]|uniref:YfhO family protein n=1 Tax=Dyella acidiphila TaxID=2775866 RepID=A0ABR9GEV5_9GAMM|nr:hypothetical protein [Dyella acidiphila]MBE1162587.1 hypothetical protein [Dyella acidiphila]